MKMCTFVANLIVTYNLKGKKTSPIHVNIVPMVDKELDKIL